MNRLPLILATLFCISFSQLNAQNVTFKLSAKQGETLSYYLFHNKYNPNNRAFKRNTDTVVINFKLVRNLNKQSILEMEWDFSKETPTLFSLEGLKKIVKEVKQTPIELLLDSNGKYLSVNNWEVVKKRCVAKIEEGKAKASSQDKPTWDYWKTKVQTQEQIEQLFMSDIEFLFMLFGSELVVNKAFDYEDELLYSKTVLPASTRLTVEEDSLNKKLLRVQLFTLPDPKKAEAQLNQYRKMAREQEDNPDVMPEKAMFDLQDFYRYTYDTTDNSLKNATYLRYIRTGTKELVEEWFFRQVY